MKNIQKIHLTEFSHGAGCGCKISPQILDQILSGSGMGFQDPKLLVGNVEKDDAGAYDLGDGTAVLSTLDFFMPIVDDPFDFGRIASTNAISDIYAMGGLPFMAIAILGWPVGKISEEIAKEVIEGAKSVCRDAKIVLAGGHSIDNPEPIFGLSVNGRVLIKHLKKNSTATENCSLFLTKPIGAGIISTAKKKKVVEDQDYQASVNNMLQLNCFGAVVSKFKEIKAMTDVTGFGLLGHLGEMLDSSALSAEIYMDKIPLLPNIHKYIAQGNIPGGTKRNWDSYQSGIEGIDTEFRRAILCDPQTSGGLLIAVENTFKESLVEIADREKLEVFEIGKILPKDSFRIRVV